MAAAAFLSSSRLNLADADCIRCFVYSVQNRISDQPVSLSQMFGHQELEASDHCSLAYTARHSCYPILAVSWSLGKSSSPCQPEQWPGLACE